MPAKRIIAFPVWLKYSIAAGIAAIIVTSLFMYTSSDNNTIAISRVDTVKKEITSQPAAPVVAGVQDNKIQASHQDTVTKGQHATIAVALVTVPKIRKHQSVNSSYPAPGIAINKPGNDIVAGPVVNALPLATTKQIIADKKITPVAEEKEVPAFAAQSTDEAPKKTFWDKVPLNDIKKQQLENLAGAIAGAYEQVNDAKQTIEDKQLTVRVEKRKLMISF